MDYLGDLNERQREAVTYLDGPLLVLAGAGSGKTRVITYKIAYLIGHVGVDPRHILAVTFTNKAADEMKLRVEKLLGERERSYSNGPERDSRQVIEGAIVSESLLKSGSGTVQPTISTFHSFCARLLRRSIESLGQGYTQNFSIYDDEDQLGVIKSCMKELGIDEKTLPARVIQSVINGVKSRGLGAEAYAEQARASSDSRRLDAARVFDLYEQRLRAANALDFDDLLLKALEVLRKKPDVRTAYNERFRHVMVDEFQDTNSIQYELTRLLTRSARQSERGRVDQEALWQGRSLCVVGDIDQCLPSGSLVFTPTGSKPIEQIRKGERILAAGGHGRTLSAYVEKVKSKEYSGRLIEIVTEQGKRLRATPNHVLFGKLTALPDKHIVYLMYRQDKGYRIGRAQGVRSESQINQEAFGLHVRSNQEHADKTWVLKVCDSKSEAVYHEVLYAAKYGIPTAAFHLCGRSGMALTQAQINRLYEEIDTRARSRRLFEDLNLFVDYPHLRPRSRSAVNRFIVNLTMFGDGRTSASAPWGGHRISFNTSEEKLRPYFEQAGFKCRAGQRCTWRVESARVNYSDACAIIDAIRQIDPRIDVLRKAILVRGSHAFVEFPASHFHPGMSIAVLQNGEIVEDRVAEVVWYDYSGQVYDLDVADVHNFICEGIVCHNSIYSWRGADTNIILGFERDFEGTKVITLDQNYRSTKTILSVANCLISHNLNRKEKVLHTENEQGELVGYYHAYNGEDEATFVAERIHRHLQADPPTKLGVLYRTNAQSRLFEEACRRQALSFNIVGGFSFYKRAEIRDIVAYLKLVLNRWDDGSLRRIINSPPRGIGKKTMEAIEAAARSYKLSLWDSIGLILAERMLPQRNLEPLNLFASIIEQLAEQARMSSLSEIVRAAIHDTGYAQALQDRSSSSADPLDAENRLMNLEELMSAAAEAQERGESLTQFIDHAGLVSDADDYDPEAPVTLMTMHSAKGLEFPIVFVVGLEEGLFPHARSSDDEAELEEERRLFYVAITRAKKHLYIAHAKYRRSQGLEAAAEPSRFLRELPAEMLKDHSDGESWLSLIHNQVQPVAARPERTPTERRVTYVGKTYNSLESIQHFFKERGIDVDLSPKPTGPIPGGEKGLPDVTEGQTKGRGKRFRPGMRVRHPLYGIGQVLKRERTGDRVLLTVHFPGFGQRKLVEELAELEPV